jgi:hypothetical protein
MRSEVFDHLANALDPARFAVERCGWRPDPWQASALISSAPVIMLCCSRQSGKSTTIAMKATHRAAHYPGSTILILARALRQCGELMRTIKAFLEASGERLAENNVTTVRLANGSRIISIPAKEETIRSIAAVDLLIEDESAFVPDAVHRAVQPMLAVKRGQLVMMSSPFGKRGHFFDMFTGKEPIDRYAVPWTDCPRISPQIVTTELERYGQAYVDQEYLCKFIETDDAVFRHEDIARAVVDDVEPLFEAA